MATENGFVNRSAELNFILTKMDGAQRCNMLGIERVHYVDAAKAKLWHDGLLAEMEGSTTQAKECLTHIYNRMTGVQEVAPERTLLSVGVNGESNVYQIADGKGGSTELRSPVSTWVAGR